MPHVKKQTIQCLCCQDFGHTRSYCNNQLKYIRCGEKHLSNTCQKSSNLLAKCALCADDHPAKTEDIQPKRNSKPHFNQKKIYQRQNHSVLQYTNVRSNIVNATSNSTTAPPPQILCSSYLSKSK